MVKSIQDQLFANQYVGAASITILFYDFLLTLPREIECFWATGRITWVSGLFYLNRYFSLLGHVPVVFEYFSRSSNPTRLQTCVKLTNFHQYLAVIIQVVVGLLLIIRTYALYNCSKLVLAVTCSAGFAVICYGVYCVFSGQEIVYTVDDLPPFGCLLPLEEAVSKKLSRAWTAMLAFDILIFSMTLYKSLTYRREGSHILQIMLRDGTIYFGVMLASTSSVLLSFYLLSEYEQGITAILTNIISSTMISRLMLNIRDPKNRSSLRPEGTAAETRTGAVFTSIIQSSADGQSFASRQDTDTALPVHSRYSELDRHDFMNNSIELRIRTTSHT